jgi:hypothetical protein
MWAAGLTHRPNTIAAFPIFYMLRFLNLFVFVRSWFEVVVQHKFRSDSPGWTTTGRRYRITTPVIAK